MIKANAYKVRDLVEEIFVRENMSREDANIAATALLDANLAGRDSHGFLRVKCYCDRLEQGGTDPRGEITIVTETPTTAVIEGNNTLGLVAAMKAAQLTRKKALESGMACVLVRNGGHYGAGGYWSDIIGQDDLITMNCSNTEALVVPFGGKNIALGTNPVSVYVPADKYGSICLDIATSTVAQGKLFQYKLKHETLGAGWAVDAEGEATTDPEKAMYLTSFGEHKGYAIAVMIEAMSAVLAGTAIGSRINSLANDPGKTNNVSYCFMAMRVDAFRPVDEFRKDADKLVEYLHSIPSAAGKRVLAPGEVEQENRCDRLANGLPLPEDLLAQLTALAYKLDISNPEDYFIL